MGIFPLVKEWYVSVQFSNRERRLFVIQRDQELIDQFYEIGREFLENHLIPQIPPAIDGSDSSKRYLNYRYPKDQEPLLETDDPTISYLMERLRNVTEERKTTEAMEAELQNQIKAIIGLNAGIKCPAGRVTWTANKDSVKIDYEKVGLDMAEQLGLAMKNNDLALNIYGDFKISHSTIKPGARVFRVQFPK
jgi:predicted phage-related endonuclease